MCLDCVDESIVCKVNTGWKVMQGRMDYQQGSLGLELSNEHIYKGWRTPQECGKRGKLKIRMIRPFIKGKWYYPHYHIWKRKPSTFYEYLAKVRFKVDDVVATGKQAKRIVYVVRAYEIMKVWAEGRGVVWKRGEKKI